MTSGIFRIALVAVASCALLSAGSAARPSLVSSPSGQAKARILAGGVPRSAAGINRRAPASSPSYPTTAPISAGSAAPTGALTQSSQPTIPCSGDVTAALTGAVARGATVVIGPGTCTVNNHVPVEVAGTTISGAGAGATFLVQTGPVGQDIFHVTADNVTIENINLNTATYQAGYPPVFKAPVAPVLVSTGNNTHIHNVTGEAGTGFGMRFVGDNLSCVNRTHIGPTLTNVDMTNTGVGGFAAIDVSCNGSGSLTRITIHGGILALYKDSNVSVNGETYTPGPYNSNLCGHPWEVTAGSNIVISNVVSYGGPGRVKSGTSAVVTNQTILGAVC